MKTFLFSLVAAFWGLLLFNSFSFDQFDFTSSRGDISWDDITDELWP
ncbi:hypothetical protein J2I47_13915 [Fibrella sp. HMF5335]|uniref:Uncharacterized protein n=1 Tax=Fibrella rubiginis TaxID=2817060 RepID=A0A939GI53_9BACT|nr:hypothetical protein [Fibrella rubiginis]MBO0937649.1 hypothetical protein [Fibrella rubiginis]